MVFLALLYINVLHVIRLATAVYIIFSRFQYVSHYCLPILHFVDNELETVAHDCDYSITVTDRFGKFARYLGNNENQIKAIRAAMSNRLSLIQGPPGLLYFSCDFTEHGIYLFIIIL